MDTPAVALATLGLATAMPSTAETTDTAGLMPARSAKIYLLGVETYVSTPSARVRPVPKIAQTINGHLNLASLPSLFSSAWTLDWIVGYVVRLRPSYSGLGKRVMKSANGPPSPSPVPNSSAMTTYRLHEPMNSDGKDDKHI